MKISFNSSKEAKPTEHEGMNVIYGAGKRAAFKIRWYFLLALVASPLLILGGKVAVSLAMTDAPGKLVLPTAEVYSPEMGVIKALTIKPGDQVQQGQIIGELEDMQLDYRLSTLQALAERDLSAEQKLARSQELQVLNAEVKRANAWYNTTRKMKAEGVLTQMEESQASQGLLNARTNLMRQQIASAGQSRVEGDLQIERQGELEYLLKRQDRLRIIAGASGKVIEVPLKQGQSVSAGDLVARVDSDQPATAQIYLNPDDLYRAEVGAKLSIILPGGKKLHGEIVKSPTLAVRMPTELKEAFSENQMGVLVNVQILDNLQNIELIDQLPIKGRFPCPFNFL
ncbi:biotin/lipoyl-binding protein [Pseudomonas fluorescens]|uniref:HlyD family secretion protein n=1 Tax=Pseudomonas fluorescens TaxID=294 RepID=UPI0019309F37|nr:biotin/lipoyl-binding protein [Pseudomonas fluorescens]MBD8089136.1 biotin/lipoyl-binding protein [Pseudomonas fluorescens]